MKVIIVVHGGLRCPTPDGGAACALVHVSSAFTDEVVYCCSSVARAPPFRHRAVVFPGRCSGAAWALLGRRSNAPNRTDCQNDDDVRAAAPPWSGAAGPKHGVPSPWRQHPKGRRRHRERKSGGEEAAPGVGSGQNRVQPQREASARHLGHKRPATAGPLRCVQRSLRQSGGESSAGGQNCHGAIPNAPNVASGGCPRVCKRGGRRCAGGSDLTSST